MPPGIQPLSQGRTSTAILATTCKAQQKTTINKCQKALDILAHLSFKMKEGSKSDTYLIFPN
eukprot:12199503-Ditylum_brightwellii.AAC.1